MPTPVVAIPQINSSDRVINQLQQNIITGINQLQQQITNSPTNGTFITSAVSTGNNIIKHNLQRVPTGFILTDIDAPTTIYRVQYTNSTVTLNSSATANLTMYLF